MTPLVDLRQVSVTFGTSQGPILAVSAVDLAIRPGEIVGIAGESGSGKTTLCRAIMGALPDEARLSGEIWFAGTRISGRPVAEIRRLWGREIAMVLQNPMTALDPLYPIGSQIDEMIGVRFGAAALPGRALEILRSVHLTAPELRLRQYPHQLSGGMRQRVLIGMASATRAKLLLADEPTTALDATIQEEILVLFREIRDRSGTAIVIVTHDLGVIRRVCERVIVMYGGRVVEDGPTEAVFTAPRHPYTRALLESLPRIEGEEIVLQAIDGQVPDPSELGDFCPFSPRCRLAREACLAKFPGETRVTGAHRVFCWAAEQPP
ncbi:MAG: ABC transporter ATP-binding protein [Alphaproteobacteria bacterium]|nr:ABC transporter ATP-binding protein [Alphaproteobacteria bacterium]